MGLLLSDARECAPAEVRRWIFNLNSPPRVGELISVLNSHFNVYFSLCYKFKEGGAAERSL